MQQTVTVVGTGRMGSALATALFNQGVATTVWNRTLSKTAPLARLGLRAAASLEQASYPSGIGQPECTIFYSGSKEVFDRIRPVLMLLGGNTTYLRSSLGHASALIMDELLFEHRLP